MLKKYARRDLTMLFSALVLLGLSYWLCRYVFLDFHGMKQWPNFLAIISLGIIIVASFIRKVWLSLITSVGYIGGFGFGFLFQSDVVNHDGLKSNNLWILWMIGLLSFVVIGILVEIAIKRKLIQISI